MATKFNHKGCERQIFLFSWQQRAKNLKPAKEHGLFAHQYFDSAYPVWLKGERAQIYYSQILPPQEFQGGALNAPRNRPATVSDAGRHTDGRDLIEEAISAAGDSDFNYELLQRIRDSGSSNLPRPGKLDDNVLYNNLKLLITA